MPRKTKEADGKIEDVKKKKTSSTRKKTNKKTNVKQDAVSSFKEALQILENLSMEDEQNEAYSFKEALQILESLSIEDEQKKFSPSKK